MIPLTPNGVSTASSLLDKLLAGKGKAPHHIRFDGRLLPALQQELDARMRQTRS